MRKKEKKNPQVRQRDNSNCIISGFIRYNILTGPYKITFILLFYYDL